jgi:hypothetical protein
MVAVVVMLLCAGSFGRAEEPEAEAAQEAEAVQATATTPETEEVVVPALADEASLTLGDVAFDDALAGAIWIRDADSRLVARLVKEKGRSVTVRLVPGRYTLEWKRESCLATIKLEEAQRVAVDRVALCGEEAPSSEKTPIVVHRRRRPAPRGEDRSDSNLRRWRLTLDSGLWLASGSSSATIVVTDFGFHSHDGGVLGGFSLGYRISPEWMITFGNSNRVLDVTEHGGPCDDDYERTSVISTFSAGARFYLPGLVSRAAVKPYVSAGVGPAMALDVEHWDDCGRGCWRDSEEVRTSTVFSGQLGAGFDVQPTSWLVLGAEATYHLAPDFSEPVSGHDNASGFTFSFQAGVTFGPHL